MRIAIRIGSIEKQRILRPLATGGREMLKRDSANAERRAQTQAATGVAEVAECERVGGAVGEWRATRPRNDRSAARDMGFALAIGRGTRVLADARDGNATAHSMGTFSRPRPAAIVRRVPNQ